MASPKHSVLSSLLGSFPFQSENPDIPAPANGLRARNTVSGNSPSDSFPTLAGSFATTHWTVVLLGGRAPAPGASQALSVLCQSYWSPIYAYVRRRGYSAPDAQDLTQEFFARLLAKNYLRQVDRTKGRFRSFLLAAVNHFLANEWDRTQAAKRGGGNILLPLDIGSAENRYVADSAPTLDPEKCFERRWALDLLERVLAQLRNEYAGSGRAELFDLLKEALTAGKSSAPYAVLAVQLQMSEGAVKVAVHRLRRRYRELLRAEIAQTVASENEIDDEIRYLFAALSG